MNPCIKCAWWKRLFCFIACDDASSFLDDIENPLPTLTKKNPPYEKYEE